MTMTIERRVITQTGETLKDEDVVNFYLQRESLRKPPEEIARILTENAFSPDSLVRFIPQKIALRQMYVDEDVHLDDDVFPAADIDLDFFWELSTQSGFNPEQFDYAWFIFTPDQSTELTIRAKVSNFESIVSTSRGEYKSALQQKIYDRVKSLYVGD